MRRKPKSNDPWDAFVEFCEGFGGPTFSAQVQQAMGLRALANLQYQSDRGNTTASKYLADRWLGLPAMSPTESAKVATEEEARERLVQIYIRRGMTEEAARAFALADPDDDEDTNGE